MLDRTAADVELRHAPTMMWAGTVDLDAACNLELAALVASLAEADGQFERGGHGT